MNRLLVWALVAALVAALAGPWAMAGEPPRVLTLLEAVQLALERNPDLAVAQQRLAAAQAALGQADAAFWPQLRVSGSYVGSDNPVQAFMMTLNQRAFKLNTDFNHPDTTDNLNTKLLATYSLYNGGRDRAAHDAAKLGAAARAAALAAVRNDLVFTVTRSFYTIGKARLFIGTAAAAVASMDANLAVASNRYTQGTVLKSDLLDVEVRLAAARETQVTASNALAIAEVIFRNVLGVGETGSVTAAATDWPLAERDEGPASELSGLAERPELLAAQKAVAAAERQVRVAVGGYQPRLNAFASYDLDSGDARRFSDSWLAGVSVEWDAFDGLLTRGKVAEARANLEAVRAELRQTELALQLEIKQAELTLADARARRATTGRAVTQAAESLQITKERYGNGLALLTQLLDAEAALTAARQRQAAAEADCAIARAALDKALGRGWKEPK